LSGTPFEAGDFIWSKFPLSVQPDPPSLEHFVYTMGVSGVAGGGYAAVVAYTTSQTLPDPLPLGVLRFEMTEAARMGHNRPFVLHSGRLGHLPAKPNYFPRLDNPSHGVIGRALDSRQMTTAWAAVDLLKRRPEAIEHLGPPTLGKRPGYGRGVWHRLPRISMTVSQVVRQDWHAA